jgi:hypothetical protein
MVAVVLATRTSHTAPLMRDGVPVWPVRNDADLTSLRAIVSVLGGQVCLVDDAESVAAPGPGVVAGLGRLAAKDACLYAHLTGRTPVPVDTVAQLANLPELSVVVTTYEYIDEGLMDALYEPGHRAEAPGIVFSYPGEDLRRQVLARAATKYLSPLVAQLQRVDVYPDLPFGAAFSRQFSILGGGATASQLRTAFGLGAGVLTLSTHSDGIDAKLRPDLVLCPMDATPTLFDAQTAPACLLTSTCHRMNAPIDAARESGRFLTPSDIRARVFVHSVCWGLFPAQDVQASGWSLARRVINGLQVAALLTSWEITSQSVATTAGLFHDIARGEPLGRALATHLATAEARRQGHQLCLVGDPAVRLLATPHADPLAAAIEGSIIQLRRERAARDAAAPAAESAVSDSACISLLLTMINSTQPGGAADANDPADRVRAAVRAYQTDIGDAVQPGPSGRWQSAAGEAVRQEATDYFATRHTDLLKYWYQDAGNLHVEPRRTPCIVCGRRTITRRYTLDPPSVSPRRHTLCPNCGPVQDVPVARRIRLVPAGEGVVRWLGYRPRREWCARLVVEPQLDAYRLSWRWPAGADGAPLMEFCAPHAWPTLPVRVALLVFWGPGHFAASGYLTRIVATSAA